MEAEVKGNVLGGLWTKYMGKEEVPSVASAPKMEVKIAAAGAPSTVTVNAVQIENTPAYASLYEAVLSRVSPFTSLLKTYKSLESIIVDENQRFAAAVKALESTGGFSSDQINQAIVMHMGLLENAKKKFDKDMNEQLDGSVGSLEKEHASALVSIEQKQADIARLQNEITEAEARRNTLSATITTSKEKFASIAQTFSAAAESLGNTIRFYQQKLGKL